jgi:RNA polymerase sigma factor (sigma-70 family)
MEKLNELDQLVKQYKKKKNKNILDQIFKIIYPIIMEKAKYVFYEQTFNYHNYEFKLVNTKKMELDDVIQELSLEVIELIKKFEGKVPFSHYLNTTFKNENWKEFKFINTEFIKNLHTGSIYKMIQNDEGEEEINIADNLPTPEEIKIEFYPELTKIEQEVWELIQGNLNLSYEEIGEELGVTKMTISRIIARIREKTQK